MPDDPRATRFLQILEVLPVVMQHRVVERIDALEVIRVERVLRTHPVRGFGAKIGLQKLQHRSQDRQARQAHFPAAIFKPFQQLVVEQGVEDDAGGLLDFGKDPVKLLLRAHQRIDVLDRRDLGVLRGRGPRYGGQCLTGGIRNEMKMKITAGTLRHDGNGD